MNWRCLKCRVVYVVSSLIIINPYEVTCHCGTKLQRTNHACLDPKKKLGHRQINYVVRTNKIPEAVS